MKLTTKSRYGVRAIFDIAYHAGGLPAQIKDISDRQRISPRYLEQIFQKLKKAGILGSKRGPKGGYFLLKEPKDITVYDIIACTEGPIELVFCVGEDDSGEICSGLQCNLKDGCVASPLWKEMGDQIAQIFRDTSIQNLCKQAEELGIERQLDARFMYYI
ncbi:MAG: Rrf2 family transcriptional regulator [Deferrisomatales bacterium]|nr:Rrf2 family transcriptional regulator [Deferrisomatales bacterium]